MKVVKLLHEVVRIAIVVLPLTSVNITAHAADQQLVAFNVVRFTADEIVKDQVKESVMKRSSW